MFIHTQNESAAIRNLAVRCLGLCAMLDRDFAQSHLMLFLQVAQVDEETLQKTAIEVIFDLVSIFGIEAFAMAGPADESPDAEHKHAVVAILLRYLDRYPDNSLR